MHCSGKDIYSYNTKSIVLHLYIVDIPFFSDALMVVVAAT